MSTSLVKSLCSVTLTGSIITCYTSPVNTYTVIRSATVVNNTTGVIPAEIHKVANGGSSDDTNILVPSKNIAAKDSYPCLELVNKVLEPGDTIQAKGNGLTLVVDGVQVVQP